VSIKKFASWPDRLEATGPGQSGGEHQDGPEIIAFEIRGVGQDFLGRRARTEQ